MTQYIIVGLIMLACVFFLLRKFVFKPKKRDCSSGCGKCGRLKWFQTVFFIALWLFRCKTRYLELSTRIY